MARYARGTHPLNGVLPWRNRFMAIILSRLIIKRKVQVLDLGAEDYVVKPFSVNELLARIRRILASRQQTETPQNRLFDDGNLMVDFSARLIKLNGHSISLTKKEWGVLEMLMSAPGKLVTQSGLLSHIWGPSHTQDSQYLRNIVRQLRIKLQDDASNPQYLETEPGIGYRFLVTD